MATKERITANRLRELMHYDPETGVFTWKIKYCDRLAIGDVCGYQSARDGYWRIGIDRFYYLAHRLAWLYMTGTWPEKVLDHRDTDKSNNRWSNLREADKSQNGANRGVNRNNTSGHKGVAWSMRDGKWQAGIKVGGIRIALGLFNTKRAAAEAYAVASRRYFGEFARTS